MASADVLAPPRPEGQRALRRARTEDMESPQRKVSTETCSTVVSEGDRGCKPLAIPLRGVVQHYAWGKAEDESLVAAMARGQDDHGTKPADGGTERKFAEFWMGTHKNGHSSVLEPAEAPVAGTWKLQAKCLKDAISGDPEHWLGDDWSRGDLPYLFKVLSVRQALSIQAHPNKRLAEQLHSRRPEHYPDDNHKPEICIPLDHFEALVGFRPIAEVRSFLRSVEELRALCCGEAADVDRLDLRELFSRVMRSDALLVQRQAAALTERLAQCRGERSEEEALILRLAKDYPGDVGIFAVYFLNLVCITADMPRRFIYCAPDEPHAYLLGDAVECMAISDNVVRAGLTSKHKDVDTLLEMMTYRDNFLDELVGVGEQVAPHVTKYDPSVEDFVVYEIDGPVAEGLCLPHAAITTCVRGSFRVHFQPADGPEDEGGWVGPASDSAGPQLITQGQTFFSRAGSELVVVGGGDGAKLFVATY